MSLQLHVSAHSDELLARLRPALAAARAEALAAGPGLPRPVPVLVPTSQLGDWLQVRLARDLGLSMGFEFLDPRAYFTRHLPDGAAAAEFADGHAFWNPDRLRWRILPHVEAIAENLGHDPTHPLAARNRFAFADLLARQLDRYARFRPDWPARWEKGLSGWAGEEEVSAAARSDEAWQRELWRELATAADARPHPARLLARLVQDAPAAAPAAPPLFVVGTDLVDPLLLRTLEALSRRGQTIDLFLLLPSLGYLADVSRRDRWRTGSADEAGGHPLLASLGQQAVGTFLLIESIAPDYAAWPEPAAPDAGATPSLLRRLQDDIRLQRPPPGPPADPAQPDPRPEFADDDRSLRVHCCHSPRRELEVLRDELLRAFAELPGLQPEDVLVAVTDFDTYAPLAEGILRTSAHPPPVRLTAIPAREANPIAAALLALLHLAEGRRAASEVLELLNLSALQHRLEIAGKPELISQLAGAIRQSGLTHGLDARDRGASEDTGTWRAALDRHLAGSWFGPVDDARDAAGALVHPIAGDVHHHDETLGRLVAWLTDLAGHLEIWVAEAPAAAWADRLGRAVDDLLGSAALDDHAAAVRRLLGQLAGVGAATAIDAGAVRDWLQAELENATSLRTNLGGEILLGRIDQVHGLPCRVLAILGLEDDAYPRATRRPAWDLLAPNPRRWDGDARTRDRQWFLDGILAPRDRLILSAANRSLRTPHDGPLSSCVEELLRVAGDTMRSRGTGPTLRQQIVVSHRIQPFVADYFQPAGGLPRSFDAAAARIAAEIAHAPAESAPPFYSGTAAPPADGAPGETSLTLGQLVAFWRDPARAWLQALQIELGAAEDDDRALDDSPATLDALQAYTVRAAALEARLPAARLDAATIGDRLAADRTLPPGALGALAWEKLDREIQPLAENLAPLRSAARPLTIDLDLGLRIRLTGELLVTGVEGATPCVLCHRPGKYDDKRRYQLEAFVQTLAAAAQLARPVACRVLGLDQVQPRELAAIDPADARRILGELIAGCREGQRRPLCFAPETSAAVVAAGAESEDPLAKARADWSHEPFGGDPGGEGLGEAASLAWRDADPFAPPRDAEWLRWAQAVAAPLVAWWDAAGRPAPAAGKARRS